METVIALLIGAGAGLLGALTGLGGGVIIVPALTILLGLPIHQAIASSLVAIVATSGTAASRYLKAGFVNVPLSLLFMVTASLGAIFGSYLGIYLSGDFLTFFFGVFLLFMVYLMIKGNRTRRTEDVSFKNTSFSDRYFDPAIKSEVSYSPSSVGWGTFGAIGAGIISGLLGVGGGSIQVPLMHKVMGIPMKAAVATSSLVIGVTAVAAATVYFLNGYVDPHVTAAVILGVFVGAYMGSGLTKNLKSEFLVRFFALALFVIAIRMLIDAM